MTAEMASQEQIGDAVVALLSVGGHSLERTWSCVEALREEGLLDPQVVEHLDEGEIVRRLGSAGYDRGPLVTTMMGRRLEKFHAGIREGVLRQACERLEAGDERAAETALCSLNGVGPAVFANFVLLRSSPNRKSISGTDSEANTF